LRVSSVGQPERTGRRFACGFPDQLARPVMRVTRRRGLDIFRLQLASRWRQFFNRQLDLFRKFFPVGRKKKRHAADGLREASLVKRFSLEPRRRRTRLLLRPWLPSFLPAAFLLCQNHAVGEKALQHPRRFVSASVPSSQIAQIDEVGYRALRFPFQLLGGFRPPRVHQRRPADRPLMRSCRVHGSRQIFQFASRWSAGTAHISRQIHAYRIVR